MKEKSKPRLELAPPPPHGFIELHLVVNSLVLKPLECTFCSTEEQQLAINSFAFTTAHQRER